MTKKKEETNKTEKFIDNHPVLQTILILAFCGVALLINSCVDSDTGTKAVTNSKILMPSYPSSFTEGDLSHYVEIVTLPAYLIHENDTTKSGIVTHYTLDVNVRLKSMISELANIDADDITFTSDQFMIGLRGLTLILKDDNKDTLNENDYFMLTDKDVPKLKQLLKAPTGTEETLTFEYTGSPNLLKEAESYAPSIAASLSKKQPTKVSKTIFIDGVETLIEGK